MEVDELLALYVSFEHVQRDHMDEFSKEEIYKLITCSVDIDNKLVMDLWKDYCRDYRDVEELQFPYSPGPDLYDLESYYKMLDLYFQFSRKVGLPVQEENLVEERRNTEEEISRILKRQNVPATPENAQSVEENFPGIIRFPSANAALNVEKSTSQKKIILMYSWDFSGGK